MGQEIFIMVANFLFALALIPSIRGKSKPPRSTCAWTAALLYGCAASLASLGLWLAAAGAVICGIAWTVLLVQKRGKNGNGRNCRKV